MRIFQLSPLVKLGPFEKIEMKCCECRISESVKARNLCQLIGDDEKYFVKFEENMSYCPFYILVIANAISLKVLVLEARNFNQLIEYNEKINW